MLHKIQLPSAPIVAPGNSVFEGHLNPVTPSEYEKAQEKREAAESGVMSFAALMAPSHIAERGLS